MGKDVVTVTNAKQGALSKITNSFSGILIGILILIGGIGLLGWNEKNNVKNIKDVKELRKEIVEVTSTSVDPSNEGKLIATNGKLNYNESTLSDTVFNVSVKTPKLVRNVEIYEWVEESETNDDTTTYTYTKEWKDEIVDSTEFNTVSGHENPAYMAYESESFITEEDLKIGAFTLSNGYKDLLVADKSYANLEGITLPEGYTIYNKYITNSTDLTNPQIGDIRISYEYANYTDASVLGKQVGESITDYTTKKNTTFKKLVKGVKTGTAMINAIEKGNKFMKWIYRLLGVIMIITGVGMILGPITTIIGFIPFVGPVVNSMIGAVSAIIGLIIALIVIAISWFVARPIIGIIALILIGGLIFVLFKYVKKNKPETKKEEK